MPWLTNQFLIAMPSITDSIFDRSVILVCQHNKEGALGIVINKLTDWSMKDILEKLDLQVDDVPEIDTPVYFGGPVQTGRGLVLHDSGNSWEATIEVGNELGLTMSKDVLEAISNNCGPSWCMPLLGFSGWESQQLESEMEQNLWLTTPADSSIIFDTPTEQRWQKAASLIGVDIESISTIAGHA